MTIDEHIIKRIDNFESELLRRIDNMVNINAQINASWEEIIALKDKQIEDQKEEIKRLNELLCDSK
jgi:hypothetical protein